jgi:hypothetical protein
MGNFDARLIAPGEEQLAGALGKAMKAANRGNKYHANRMERDPEFWGRFARDVLRGPAEGRRRSCKGGRAVPEVVAGWWTDPAGRKHVRVIGRTRATSRYSNYGLRREGALRELPPWWHVYPEAVLGVRGRKEGERFLAVCRCGAVGTPESLGWMGDTCGPCFDRRADGGVPAGGFGQFPGWAAHVLRFGYTADGRHLVGQNLTGQLWRVGLEDGSTTASRKKMYAAIASLASTPEGTTFVMNNAAVVRWRTDADEVESVIPGRQFWGRIALAPDASRVALLGYQQAHTADLTAARPKYATHQPPTGFYALHFGASGSQLFGLFQDGALYALDPETLQPAVIREAFPNPLTGYSPPTDMVVARDGSAALVRRDQYSPRRVLIRHVPLPAGDAVDLQVPQWHQPTTLAYSPDRRHAITAEAEQGWVGFFEVASGKCLGFVRAVLEDVGWRNGQVEFAPDGTSLAVLYNNGGHENGATVAVWPWPDVLRAAGSV